jgi:hypothetical protein
VNVIGNAAYGERLHFVVTRNAAEIWPQPITKVRINQRRAIFCAPDARNQATGK